NEREGVVPERLLTDAVYLPDHQPVGGESGPIIAARGPGQLQPLLRRCAEHPVEDVRLIGVHEESSDGYRERPECPQVVALSVLETAHDAAFGVSVLYEHAARRRVVPFPKVPPGSRNFINLSNAR